MGAHHEFVAGEIVQRVINGFDLAARNVSRIDHALLLALHAATGYRLAQEREGLAQDELKRR